MSALAASDECHQSSSTSEPDTSSADECSNDGDDPEVCEHAKLYERNEVVGPPGPTSLGELFNWPEYNAHVLLETSPSAEMRLEGVRKLLSRNLIVNESYSGMGTGGYTLHLQHKHFLSILVR